MILLPSPSNLRMRAAVTLVLKVGQRWRTVFQRNEDSKEEEEEAYDRGLQEMEALSDEQASAGGLKMDLKNQQRNSLYRTYIL